MRKYLTFIVSIAWISFIVGIAMSDIGEKRPTNNLEYYTTLDMVGLSLFLIGFFVLGFLSARDIYKADKYSNGGDIQ